MSGDEGARRLEVVGRLDGQGLHSGHGPLGETDEGAGRGELEQARDAEREHRLHAAVPAHGVADLVHEPVEGVGSVGHGGAVGVRQQADGRVADGVTSAAAAASASTAGDMWWVWNAPATWSGMTRALAGAAAAERFDLLEGARGDDLAGAVDVGRRQAVGLEGREDLLGVAAEHGRHAGRGDRTGLGHGAAAGRDEGDRLVVGDDAREGGRGELPDGVSGEDGARGGELGA